MLKDAPCWISTGLHSYNCVNGNRGRNALLVVVHGLGESGVFSSVIASAQKFFSSVKNSNSSMTVRVISSRKIGHGGESQATARRILQISDYFFHQSPPGLEDVHIEM